MTEGDNNRHPDIQADTQTLRQREADRQIDTATHAGRQEQTDRDSEGQWFRQVARDKREQADSK